MVRSRMSRAERIFVGLFGLLAAIAVFVVGTLPRAGEEVVVFARPWSAQPSAYGIVAGSGGDLVSATNIGWAVIARSDDARFISKLYLNGALFVSNMSLAALCGAAAET